MVTCSGALSLAGRTDTSSSAALSSFTGEAHSSRAREGPTAMGLVQDASPSQGVEIRLDEGIANKCLAMP